MTSSMALPTVARKALLRLLVRLSRRLVVIVAPRRLRGFVRFFFAALGGRFALRRSAFAGTTARACTKGCYSGEREREKKTDRAHAARYRKDARVRTRDGHRSRARAGAGARRRKTRSRERRRLTARQNSFSGNLSVLGRFRIHRRQPRVLSSDSLKSNPAEVR